jgi:hypothetical protein
MDYFPARKRATRIKERQLLAHIILFKRVLYVFPIFAVFFPRIYAVSPAPEFLVPVFCE